MSEPIAILERAVADAQRTLDSLELSELSLPTPCADWTVRDVVNHLIDTTDAFATALAGGIGEIHSPPPDTFDTVPGAAYASASQRMVAGTHDLTADSAPMKFSFGEMPPTFVGYASLADTLLHHWDVLKATGRERRLDPEAAELVLGQAKQFLKPEFRGPGRGFGFEVPCSEDAPIVDRLAAFFGRRP